MTARKADPRVARWERVVLDWVGAVPFGTETRLAERIVRAIDRARREERKQADAAYALLVNLDGETGPAEGWQSRLMKVRAILCERGK